MIKIILILFASNTLALAINDVRVNVQDRRPEIYMKDKTPVGPIADILNTAFKAVKLRPKYYFVPWSRTLHMAKNNQDLILIRHSMKEERREFLRPIVYGSESRKVLFFKNKKSKVNANNIAELKKQKIGYRRSSFYFPEFSDGKGFSKFPVNSDKQLIKMLLSERVDFIIFNNKNILEGHLKEMGLKFSEYFEEVKYSHTYQNPRYISIPKASKYNKFYKKLNCQIFKMRRSGEISKFFENYGLTLSQTFDDPDSIRQIKNCK